MENTNIGLGIFLGIVSGIFLGSFALPMKKIRGWNWENTWVLFSLWATVVFPLILALFTIPNLGRVFTGVPFKVVVIVFLFGAGWGVANVGFGMGLKIVGMALGTAIVLGLNNAIGAILPIILYNPSQLMEPAGITIAIAVLVMIGGIIVCAAAGMKREKALSDINPRNTGIRSRDFTKGLIICLVAGGFGAMFNFALINGKPLETIAVNMGATEVNAANPTWVVALSGGFLITLLYCIYLFRVNATFSRFSSQGSLNYLFLTLAMGILWFGGVAIYGMAVSKLGALGPSIGWPLIQSMAVGSGNFWGIVTGEWKGSGRAPLRWMVAGLLLLFAGIVIIGIAAGLSPQ